MRRAAPRLAGGGDTLNSLFPGYRDKIWVQLPEEVRKFQIKRGQSAFESGMKGLIGQAQGVKRWHDMTLSAKPERIGSTYGTDYKRQMERGTFVTLRRFQIDGPDRIDAHKNPDMVYAPYSPDEQEARKKARFFPFASVAGVLVAYTVYRQYLRERHPATVYC